MNVGIGSWNLVPNTVDQLLFVSEKFSRSSREPHRREYSSLLTSPCVCCNTNTGLYKAHSRKLVVANQFVSSKSRNNVVANKSWSTVVKNTGRVNYYTNAKHIYFFLHIICL